jgi:two-component system NtrC family sensor kinase
MSTITVEYPTSTASSTVDVNLATETVTFEDERLLSFQHQNRQSRIVHQQVGPHEDDTIDYSREIVDIHEELDATLLALSDQFSVGSIRLVRDYGDIPQVDGYPRLLNQVWMNLLTNALQAVDRSDGEITVQTRAMNNMIRISVSDNGPGIPTEFVDRIFDPFYTTKAGHDAVGIGLSLSADLIKYHRGRIDVINWPGEGVRFIVTIPISAL